MKCLLLNRLLGLGGALALVGCATPEPPAPAPAPPSTVQQPMRPAPPTPPPVRPAPAVAPAAPSSVSLLETILTRVAGDKGVKIERTSTGALLLRATGDTAFDSGSANPSPRFADFLRQLANGLQSYQTLSMRVTGHTDSTGDAQLNQRLSEARAAATINLLVREGVPASRMLAEGRGHHEAVASNDTAEGRASNRRVDMLIIELPKQ